MFSAKPDWSFWGRKKTATIHAAAMLSIGIRQGIFFFEPEGEVFYEDQLGVIYPNKGEPEVEPTDFASDAFTEYKNRFFVLVDHLIEKKGPLGWELSTKIGQHIVNLAEAGDLLRKLGYSIPPEFPGVEQNLTGKIQAEKPLTPRERNNLLTIIGALVELIQTPKPGRDSETAVISEMVSNYSDKSGISERNLQKQFASAKRALQSN